MEEDAVRIVQRDGHIPATDGSGTHESNQKKTGTSSCVMSMISSSQHQPLKII